MQTEISESALDSRVRRGARTAGYVACKSRQPLHSNNKGGYQLFTPWNNTVAYGVDFDLSPEDVLIICGQRSNDHAHKKYGA